MGWTRLTEQRPLIAAFSGRMDLCRQVNELIKNPGDQVAVSALCSKTTKLGGTMSRDVVFTSGDSRFLQEISIGPHWFKADEACLLAYRKRTGRFVGRSDAKVVR